MPARAALSERGGVYLGYGWALRLAAERRLTDRVAGEDRENPRPQEAVGGEMDMPL